MLLWLTLQLAPCHTGRWRSSLTRVWNTAMPCDISMHCMPQVKAESKKVWKFIIEREIEAPARFQAIQTHRAAMAILRQQVLTASKCLHVARLIAVTLH